MIDCGRSYRNLAQAYQESSIYHFVEPSQCDREYEFKKLTVFDFERVTGNADALKICLAAVSAQVLTWMPDHVFIDELWQYKGCDVEALQFFRTFPNDLTASLMSIGDITRFPLDIHEFDMVSIHGNIDFYNIGNDELFSLLVSFSDSIRLHFDKLKCFGHKHGDGGYIDILNVSRTGYTIESMMIVES